jgi:hypothetical protein
MVTMLPQLLSFKDRIVLKRTCASVYLLRQMRSMVLDKMLPLLHVELKVCMYVFISEHFFLVWYTNCGYNVRKIFMQRRKILYIFIECNNSRDWMGTSFFHIGAG